MKKGRGIKTTEEEIKQRLENFNVKLDEPYKGNKRHKHKIKCFCGNTYERTLKAVLYEIKNHGCGCSFKRKHKYEEYLGRKISGILVKNFVGLDKNQQPVVDCVCHCGKDFTLTFTSLVTENTKSCGCARSNYKTVGELKATEYANIVAKANVRGWKVEIDEKYLWDLFVKQNGKCALSGIEIQFRKHNKDRNSTASLDRIDSSKDYKDGNVQWVHKYINMMKQRYSQEQFIQYCKAVANHNKGETCQMNNSQEA